jgi:hypothetical protein
LLQQSLREEAPLSKLGLMALGGGVIMLSALLVSNLAGQDPWGEQRHAWARMRCARSRAHMWLRTWRLAGQGTPPHATEGHLRSRCCLASQ